MTDLTNIAAQAAQCRRCPLYLHATRVVFGEGPVRAPVMMVGEQPGDREDLTGRPFVGPAGKVLDNALEKVGLERDAIYVTNAVKHFKHEERGKRRLHKRPDRYEVERMGAKADRTIAFEPVRRFSPSRGTIGVRCRYLRFRDPVSIGWRPADADREQRPRNAAGHGA